MWKKVMYYKYKANEWVNSVTVAATGSVWWRDLWLALAVRRLGSRD